MLIFSLCLFLSPNNIFAQLTVFSPSDEGSVVAGDSLIIEWSDSQKRPADIIYSLDSGKTWTFLVNSYAPTSYTWALPNISPRKIFLQILAPSEQFMDTIAVRNEAHDLSDILSAKFSPNGKLFVTSGKEGSARLWQTSDLDVILGQRFFGASNPVRSTAFYHSADTAALSAGNSVVVFEKNSNSTVAVLNADAPVRAIAVHPTRPVIAAGCNDGKVILWDVVTKQRIKTYLHPELSKALCVNFSSDGSMLIYSGEFVPSQQKAEIFLREWEDDASLRIIPNAHGGNAQQTIVWSCAISPSGKQAASGGEDRSVRIWDLNDLSQIAMNYSFRGEVRTVAYASDGRKIATGSRDSTVRILNSTNASEIYRLNHKAEVYSVDYSPSGDTVLSVGEMGTVKLWSYTSKERYPREIFLKQKLTASSPDFAGRVRKIYPADIPISAFTDINFSPKKFFVSTQIQIPNNILEILNRQNYSITNSGTTYDTITVSGIEPFTDFSLLQLKVRLKDGQDNSGEIKILSLTLTDTSEYVPRVSGGLISVLQPYKILLSLPDRTVAPGEKFSLPLRATTLSTNNFPLPENISFSVKIDFPGKLLSFNSDRIVKNRDTLTFSLNNVNLEKSVLEIPLTALSSEFSAGEVKIISLEYPDTADYLITTQDAKILVDPSCNSERRASTIGEATRLDVRPNPAKEKFFVEFTTAEDGEISFELIDLAGNPIPLLKENFIHGSYTKEFSGKNIPAGRYQMVMRTKSQILSIVFFIVK